MNEFRKAEIWEDGLRTDPKKKSFEWWYFDSSFSDGTTIVVTFFTKSASNPSGPIKPQVQITITKPTGEKLSYNKIYSAEDLRAETKQCDVKIGPNTIKGNLKKYNIHIELPEIVADIEFDRIAPSFSTYNPHDKGPVYFGWFCAIPFGRVSATLHIAGEIQTLKGTGYHDHNWGIINIKEACKYWYWGRGIAGEYSLIYCVFVLPAILGGKRSSVLYMAKGDEILVEGNNLAVTHINIDPPTPKDGHLPTELTFAMKNSEYAVEIALSKPKLIESLDPLPDLPAWKKVINNLFSKPLYVRYNAELDLTVEHNNKKTVIKGHGLYEIMILH